MVELWENPLRQGSKGRHPEVVVKSINLTLNRKAPEHIFDQVTASFYSIVLLETDLHFNEHDNCFYVKVFYQSPDVATVVTKR